MSGWPGAHRGSESRSEHPRDVLTHVKVDSVVQARRRALTHLWCWSPYDSRTLCGKNATCMPVIRANALMDPQVYWQLSPVMRFEEMFRRVTCSACTSRYLALRLLAVDGEASC